MFGIQTYTITKDNQCFTATGVNLRMFCCIRNGLFGIWATFKPELWTFGAIFEPPFLLLMKQLSTSSPRVVPERHPVALDTPRILCRQQLTSLSLSSVTKTSKFDHGTTMEQLQSRSEYLTSLVFGSSILDQTRSLNTRQY
jgi:hypothetical protein